MVVSDECTFTHSLSSFMVLATLPQLRPLHSLAMPHITCSFGAPHHWFHADLPGHVHHTHATGVENTLATLTLCLSSHPSHIVLCVIPVAGRMCLAPSIALASGTVRSVQAPIYSRIALVSWLQPSHEFRVRWRSITNGILVCGLGHSYLANLHYTKSPVAT